jgi:endonuclease/exonuclease/phosphatase family metal-dependent hydrolase
VENVEQFSLLTLNCFGVPGIRTGERLRRLAQELNAADYSVVCLQEVQSHRYRALFADQCKSCYPGQAYHQFIHAPKGGLLTLSKYPIEHSEFVLFRERGLWFTPAITDWILHKGVLITRLRLGDLLVVVMNTHLTANYTGDWSRNNLFAKQEYRELMQIAELVHAQPANALVLVCGDFNIPRGSWLYESLLTFAGLTDPLAGDQRPTFRPHLGMGLHYATPIDFTLYRAPPLPSFRTQSDLRFQDEVEIGGRKAHLSDHMGIELCLSWEA